MKKSAYQKVWPLIICFLFPMFIMACYFAYRNMSPFGSQSILTVDLGQQYIDLFAYFRHTLLSDPSGLFYSFSKAFGGEMFGTWAYYLLSPVNVILLLIPTPKLPAGILIITLIKYGLSGLSFGYLLSRTIRPNAALIIMWSTIYALNGWIIANQLNIMWLDGMIWLPIIILGIKRIFYGNSIKTYITTMTLAIITNYYMAYMIFIFTLIYICFKFTTTSLTKNQFRVICSKLFDGMLSSLGLSAWLTLPTLFSLIQGKGHYTREPFNFRFEYFPIKMISKFFNGSLNFDQLPHGLPNIFVGSVALIGFLIYFCQRKFTIKKKLGILAVTLFLIISLCFQPLDLLWHAGQFPIWYPYRFSFIFCFWIIWIAANAINHPYSINWIASTVIASIVGGLIIYVFINLVKFPFISPLNFIVGILFLLISFILLVYTHNRSKLFAVALLILSSFEMGLNVFNSLNNLSYISNDSYANYTKRVSHNVSWIAKDTKGIHRIGQTFYRSKDDPFSNHYAGGETFDSSLEYTTPKFMKRMGQPEGQGFVDYANGTLLTDQLLNYQYYLTTNNIQSTKFLSNRPDLNTYPTVHNNYHLRIHKNSKTLPFVFTTFPKALHIKLVTNPIISQEHWYQSITNRNNVKFKSSHFNQRRLSNLKIKKHHLRAINPLRTGTLSLSLRPKRHQAYYLVIGPQINNKKVKATLNGRSILPDSTYNHSIILNLASGNSSKPIKFSLNLLQPELDLKPFKLYQLNKRLINKPYSANTRINSMSNRNLSGKFKTTTSKPVLGTSVPATKGWHLTIDGQPHHIHRIAHEFIGAYARPGQHNFKLTFTPPLLKIGLAITLVTTLDIMINSIIRIKRNKKG